jgi:hypothetical protein
MVECPKTGQAPIIAVCMALTCYMEAIISRFGTHRSTGKAAFGTSYGTTHQVNPKSSAANAALVLRHQRTA